MATTAHTGLDRSAIVADRSALIGALAFHGRLADARMQGERYLAEGRPPGTIAVLRKMLMKPTSG